MKLLGLSIVGSGSEIIYSSVIKLLCQKLPFAPLLLNCPAFRRHQQWIVRKFILIVQVTSWPVSSSFLHSSIKYFLWKSFHFFLFMWHCWTNRNNRNWIWITFISALVAFTFTSDLRHDWVPFTNSRARLHSRFSRNFHMKAIFKIPTNRKLISWRIQCHIDWHRQASELF